jgi:methionyl-tRNA formyltransferase
MRFAYAGIDMMSTVFTALLQAGWTPVKLYTRPCNNPLDSNAHVVDIASKTGIPAQLSPIREEDLAELAADDTQCLVVAGYPWKVLGWEPHLPYALNFHPSPLPEGRGPYPLMRALMEERSEWGVTAHKLAPRFDAGDIIDREIFPVSPHDDSDSLLVRCQFAAGRIAGRLAAELPRLWREARPQEGGSYWQRTGNDDRRLPFDQGTAAVMARLRAFGRLHGIARIGETSLYVRNASGWEEAHGYRPGTVVSRYQQQLTIATSDGYVVLTQWTLSDPQAAPTGAQ